MVRGGGLAGGPGDGRKQYITIEVISQEGYTLHIYTVIHCYFAWRIFPVYVYIVLFLQSHAVGKGWGGADLFILVISTFWGVGGGCEWAKQCEDVGDQNSFLSYLSWRIFSVYVYIKLHISSNPWGGGGGRKICLFSSYSSVHLGVGGGGGGGVGWDGKLVCMKNISIMIMIILHCFIKFIYSLWRGLTMCTVVS